MVMREVTLQTCIDNVSLVFREKNLSWADISIKNGDKIHLGCEMLDTAFNKSSESLDFLIKDHQGKDEWFHIWTLSEPHSFLYGKNEGGKITLSFRNGEQNNIRVISISMETAKSWLKDINRNV